MKKWICILLSVCMMVSMAGCGSEPETEATEKVTVNIAYQYGLAYAPLVIAQKQELIEKAYQEKTGKEVEVIWTQMSSGADINTGIASGNINVGFMGIGPAITGVSKKVGYKIFTNLSGQEHCLTVNDDNIKSFDDLIGSEHQIALVNIGSFQHIILAKALAEAGYDPHALDSNLVAMKHPDGMSSLETKSVSGHVTTNPYIYKERENTELHEIAEVNAVYPRENSFIVGVASEELYKNDPELYEALCTGFANAIDFINENIEEAAKITCEYDGNTEEDELKYLKLGYYSTETKGLYDLSRFMFENGFTENDPGEYKDLVFDNVKGN